MQQTIELAFTHQALDVDVSLARHLMKYVHVYVASGKTDRGL